MIFFGIAGFIYLLDSYRHHRQRSVRLAFCIGWVTYALVMCWWISYFGIFALVGFATLQFIFAYVFVTFVSTVKWSLSDSIFYGLLWVLYEFILNRIPVFSFSWLSISTTLVDLPLVRISRIGGGALLSFFIVLVASYVVLNIDFIYGNAKWLFQKEQIIAVGVFLFIFVLVYSISNFKTSSNIASKSISVVQGNDKNRYLTSDEIESDYLTNSHLLLAKQINKKRDIIIFPESSFSDDPETDGELKKRLSKVAAKTNDLLLVNSIATVDSQDFNRNYFYSPSMELLDKYDKKRLVPFGEYVPLKRFIGSWSLFDRIGSGFNPGSKDVTVDGVTTLICYESTFTSDVQNALGSDTKMLVITTNNRSYRRSGNSVQHKAQSQLRAAEFGISVVHASVSGSSALIERDGRVKADTKLFKREVLSGDLSWGSPDSIYSKTGDWLSIVSLLVVVYVSLNQLRKYRWKSHTLTE